MGTYLLVFFIALKFLLPGLLIWFPFLSGWANFVLDTIDGDILIPLGLEDYNYQTIDKFADYVTYIFMLKVGWKWESHKEIKFTFALRTIGQILFFLTRDELMFFFFPNFLEPLFLIYATLLFIKKNRAYTIYKKYFKLIWGFILIYKFQDELITHVVNVDRSTLIKNLFSL
jgi:hypothetical protein